MATLDNDSAINFGTLAAAATVSHYRATFGNSTDGNEIALPFIALNNTRQFVSGDELIINAGDLNIQLPRGDFPEAFALRFLTEFLKRRRTSGDGSTAGQALIELGSDASTEITASGYTQQTADFTAASGP